MSIHAAIDQLSRSSQPVEGALRPRVICMIQARMASTRLPGKMMLPILEEPMLAHVIRRAQQIRGVDSVRVLTTRKPEDDCLVAVAEKAGVPWLRGPETDVLSRFALATYGLGGEPLAPLDRIVRITGDCPGLDPEVSSQVVQLSDGLDYCSNTQDWPDGLDTEVFTVDMLRAADELVPAHDPSREHVTPWIREHAQTRAELPLHPPQRWRKWSVDTEEDYEYVKELYAIYGPDWGWEQAVHANPGFLCEGCRQGDRHPQRAKGSISGAPEYTIWDLHEVDNPNGVVYDECSAWMIKKRRAEEPSGRTPRFANPSLTP